MTFGLIADNIDTSLIGMSLLTSINYTSGGGEYSFAKNPFASVLSSFIVQQVDVSASVVVNFPNVTYSIVGNEFRVSVAGGGTPCIIFLFVR